MRKMIGIVTLVLLLAACGGNGASGADGVLVINDRVFLTQMQAIQQEPETYLGRTIRYEGIFLSSYWPPTSEYFFYVVRFGDDCCGIGGVVGFELYLGDYAPFEDNAWVEVTGTLEEYADESTGLEFLRIRVLAIEELDERGQEFVG